MLFPIQKKSGETTPRNPLFVGGENRNFCFYLVACVPRRTRRVGRGGGGEGVEEEEEEEN